MIDNRSRRVSREGKTRCSACRKWLPTTLEFFKPSKECRGGVMAKCRGCVNRYLRRWKKKHPELLARQRARYEEKYGPLREEKARQRKLDRPLHMRAKILRSGMMDRAKVLNLPFDKDVLTIPCLMIWLQKAPFCECCKKPLDISFKLDGMKNDRSPSIDRIRPNLGYVVGNVALLCWRCNNLKRDASPEELACVARWTKRAWNHVRGNEVWDAAA